MRNNEIEAWALDVLDRVRAKARIEDSRVELKAEWPKPVDVARQLAAHGNAARGDTILWLIGVDQTRGVIGANNLELSNWWPGVQKQFDGLAPTLVDINVPSRQEGVDIVALCFETDRAPFVVRMPDKTDGRLEVPWREGTATRSAHRDELLRLLVPLQKRLQIEAIRGDLTLREVPGKVVLAEWSWYLNLDVYVVAHSGELVVVPFFNCSASITIDNLVSELDLRSIRLSPPHAGYGPSSEADSLTIAGTMNELLIHAPGQFHVKAERLGNPIEGTLQQHANLEFQLQAVGAEHPTRLDIELIPVLGASDENNVVAKWMVPPWGGPRRRASGRAISEDPNGVG